MPVASEPRMTIVELVKSLHTMQTETILHLVKEVVKKPHQIKGEQVPQCFHRTEEPCQNAAELAEQSLWTGIWTVLKHFLIFIPKWLYCSSC